MDPRGQSLDRYAEGSLNFRPGSDVALLNGMINTIITEGLYDNDYIKSHTEGFEDLKARTAATTPEAMSPICGIDAEVIDLRSLRPLDSDTVIQSVEKTGRMGTVEEGWPICSIGSELAAQVQRRAFDALDAPIEAVTGVDVPMPYAENLERLALPQQEQILDAVKRVCYWREAK